MSHNEAVELPLADDRLCGCRSRDVEPTNSFARRYGKMLQWLMPGVVLALMPKCPACFAMYFALATGVGLTMSTAASLRIIIMAVCVVIPVVAAIGPTRRFIRRRRMSLRVGDRQSLKHQLVVR